MVNLKNRHFLKLLDFTPEEIGGLLELAAELKAQKKAGIPHRMHEGKNVALIFEKTSTRTRCSFEVAAADLGMRVEKLAAYAGVPVWNGLTNEFHPTQILADFLTVQEHFGALQGIPAPCSSLRRTRCRRSGTRMCFTRISGFPWENRRKSGRSAFTICFLIR